MKFIVRFATVLLGGYCLHVSALQAGSETVLHSFCSGQTQCSDGNWPLASLLAVDGTLYGTTVYGGAKDFGTVFSVNPSTGAETVVHSFLYSDGAGPRAALTEFKGTLYGTTSGGGDAGTVYSINPKTGAEAVVYYFQSTGGDGQFPYTSLTKFNGLLYGTTTQGGTYGYGTVFSVDPTTGAETILHSFQNNGADGTGPDGSLAVVGGILYGTTYSGGTGGCSGEAPGCGTVFSIDPATRTETVLYSFQDTGADGNYPEAGLTDFKGTFYGTTLGGGVFNKGAIFSIDATTRTETVLHSFGASGKDGLYPRAGLTISNGTLYGTTDAGGLHTDKCQGFCGTVFAFHPVTDTEKVLHAFCYPRNCTDGSNPLAGVIALNGTLYGTTYWGGGITNCGKYGCGTVFAVQLHSSGAKSKPPCSGTAFHAARSTPKQAHFAACL